MKKLLQLILAICMMLCFITHVLATQSKSIQMKGSDTMVNLGQAWAEGFMMKHPDSFIAVTGGGSGTGIAALISGTCDIAQCSRQMKEKEIETARTKGIEPMEFIVALDGIAVVVHPKNPISGLTLTQLADIFTGRIKNWKELGGDDAPIVILSREVNSGTYVYFKEYVLKNNEYAETALLMPSSQAIADEVAQNPNTIGYYGIGYISQQQKAVAVEGIVPSIENVTKNSYPISRPLFMYTNGEPKGIVKDFIDFILSDDGRKIVLEQDFVPVMQIKDKE